MDKSGKIRDYKNALAFILANESDNAAVLRREEFERTAAKSFRAFALRQDASRPPQQRAAVVLLSLDVQRFVLILWIDDYRQIQLLRIGPRKSGIAVGAPLHRCAHSVAIAEVEVVTHADLVAVVDDRRSRQREQECIHQFNFAAIVSKQRRQTAANAEIDSHRPVLRVGPVHVIALFIGDHLKGQLVVIAQEHGPLAALRNVGRNAQNVRNRIPIFHAQRHEKARHDREMKRHVAFVAVPKVRDRVFRPLVSFGK